MDTSKNTLDTLPIIAMRLSEARKRAKISQKTLGMLAGIDEFSASARVNQYERGKHAPEFLILERFAAILNVPAVFFYARDDMMAEMVMLFSKLSQEEKSEIITEMKKRNTEE